MLERAAKNNPDGAGYAYVDDFGVVQMVKAASYEEIKEQMSADLDNFYERTSFLIHFRIATHGSVCGANSHPFRLSHGGVMIHNGILSIKGLPKGVSDSKYFANNVLSKLPQNWYRTPHWTDYMEQCIGTHNKIVCLYPDGFRILNEQGGIWKEGIWYSNLSGHTLPQRQAQAWDNYDDWGGDNMTALAQWRARKKEQDDARTTHTVETVVDSCLVPTTEVKSTLPARTTSLATPFNREGWKFSPGAGLWIKEEDITEEEKDEFLNSDWEEYLFLMDENERRELLAEALNTDVSHMEDDDVEDFLKALDIDMPDGMASTNVVELVRDSLFVDAE